MKYTALILLIVIILSFFALQYKHIFREKTELESTHLKVLSGVTTSDNSFKEGFGILNVFLAWEDNFPWVAEQEHKLLMITWEPSLKSSNDSILAKIIEGKYDALIRKFAQDAKGYRLLLRWGHEMNGNWYSWSGAANQKKTDVYIQAYRRVHDVFCQEGCSNVRFVFSINSEDIPKSGWNRFEKYYPGNEYVDLIGIDAYNWGKSGKWSRWKSFESLIGNSYERVIKSFPDKPIILSEIGSTSEGGDKTKWSRDFFMILEKRFTAIKAFVWFDINKETDWKLTDEIMQIFNNELYFTDDIESLNWVFEDDTKERTDQED